MTEQEPVPPVRIAWRQVALTAALLVGTYLLVGFAFGLAALPQQMWQCSEPDGSVMNYSTPHVGCQKTVGVGEQVGGVAVWTVTWGPYAAVRMTGRALG